ncbi:MAG: hypothetical protein OQK04_15785 [Kangiellaceae bacterium]|nr:hypothetical protein [Kangiellaceae bacterium]MCW9000169.1 hypothetical protein [Kangiellaceae bacterium]
MNNIKSELNRRQWLNIIIISISAMFLLIVIVSKKLSESASQQINTNQIPSSGQIQKLDFGEITIYRQGEQWSSLPEKVVRAEVARTIGLQWQQLLNRPAKPIESPINIGHTVLLFFGESNRPVICKVKKQDKITIFQFIESNLEFEIDARLQHRYLPQ